MNWLLEAYAVFYAGFGFLANNYAQCSSTEMLQLALAGTAGAGTLRMGLRAVAGERMRQRLVPVDLGSEPILAVALQRAQHVVALKRPIRCYWAEDGGPQLATLGYFRPSLIISRHIADVLVPDELEAALAHELQHARRHDVLRMDVGRIGFDLAALSVGFALVLFLAFYVGAFEMNRLVAASAVAGGLLLILPGGKALTRRLERQAEFACDRAAAAGRGGALAVAAALVKVARLEKRNATYGLPAMVPLFSAATFQLRVQRLMTAGNGAGSRHPGGRWWLAAAAALAVPAFALALPLDIEQAAAAGCSTCGLVVEKSEGWPG